MSLIQPGSIDMSRFPPSNILHTQLQLHHQILYTQHNITHHHHHPEEITNNGWLPLPTAGPGPTLPGDITVSLQNGKLWQQFHSETNEMIITKSGRRMFPSLQLQVDGLERRAHYCLLLEIAPASRCRHKYAGGGGGNGGLRNSKSRWTSAGPAESQPHVNRRVYLHPESPATGTHWMQHPVSFNKLKLTNNAVDHHNNIVLTSMHKYVPRIWIIRCDDVSKLTPLFSQPSSSFCFSETKFIAVTAYQNERITKLKIDNNPFAKGFRETGQSRCKRKKQAFEGSDTIQEEVGDDGDRERARAYNDDDESNISSSESESNRCSHRLHDEDNHYNKGAGSESGRLDDSEVSSSKGVSPPLMANKETDSQPRLHRPWTNDEDESASSAVKKSEDDQRPKEFVQPLQLTQLTTGVNYPTSHFTQLHVSAMELARIHQIQYYQQLQYEQYCHINKIRNFTVRLPFGNNHLTRIHPYPASTDRASSSS